MWHGIPPELRDAGSGIFGAALAVLFKRMFSWLGAVMFLGGCGITYYGTPFITDLLNVLKYRDLVAFLLGLFGMVGVFKVYDGLEQIQLGDIWTILKDSLRKRLGVGKEGESNDPH